MGIVLLLCCCQLCRKRFCFVLDCVLPTLTLTGQCAILRVNHISLTCGATEVKGLIEEKEIAIRPSPLLLHIGVARVGTRRGNSVEAQEPCELGQWWHLSPEERRRRVTPSQPVVACGCLAWLTDVAVQMLGHLASRRLG
jgi:hypothetical protein